jgi:hypothetical protein
MDGCEQGFHSVFIAFVGNGVCTLFAHDHYKVVLEKAGNTIRICLFYVQAQQHQPQAHHQKCRR